MEQKQRPGVMIYFDRMVPALARLNDEQAGALFRAIVEYAHSGAQTELEDLPGIVFDMLRPSIDRDSDSYGAKKLRSKYANYCKKAKAKGDEIIPFADFIEQLEDERVLTEPTRYRPDTMRSPTPEPEPTPEPKPTPEPNNNISSVSLNRAHARDDTTQTGLFCQECGKTLTDGVASYSMDKYGRPLCQKCQAAIKPASTSRAKAKGSRFKPDPDNVRSSYQRLLNEENP